MQIFFDIDGTLLDQRGAETLAVAALRAAYPSQLSLWPLPALCRRWRHLREKHAADFFRGTISCVEHRRRRVVDFFADEAPLSSCEAERRFQHYSQEYRRQWRLYPDTLPALEALRHER